MMAESLDLVGVRQERVSSWAQLDELWQSRFPEPKWLFRGQMNEAWPLRPTLERLALAYAIPAASLPALEEFTLRQFRRRLHAFENHVPSEVDTLRWFALMQHHGAPTRLLDWT